MYFENPFRRPKQDHDSIASPENARSEDNLLEEYEELNKLAAQTYTELTTPGAVDKEIGHLEKISADLQGFLIKIEGVDATAAILVSGLLSGVGQGGHVAYVAGLAGVVGAVTEVLRRSVKKKAVRTEDRLRLDRAKMSRRNTAEA